MKRYRWVVLGLMVLLTFINYVDRASLSIVAPYVMEEFALSPAQMGVLFSGFFASYALFCFIGGYVSDIYGPKKTITIALILWSVFAAAPAVAWSFASLLVFRILFGAGEGPVSSVTNKMINNWFPATERAKAKGITDTGMSLGAALAGPIVGLIAVQYGWRISFITLAVMGFVWVIFWQRLVTDLPKDHPHVSPAELQEIETGKVTSVQTTVKLPLSYYIKQPIIVATVVAFFATNYATYFFLTWFPSYLVMAHNLSIKNMAIVSVIPWLFGALGYGLGGFISDYLVKKLGKLVLARKLVISVCLAGAAVSIGLCGLVSTATAAVALMSCGIFFAYLATPSYWAIIQDSVQSDSVGRVGGFVHFLSNTAGIFAPSVTGYIVQVSGHFTSAFFLTGGLAITGALLVAVFAKPVKGSAAPGL
ncbi:MFS transporter [Sporomusa termitida]|uniref:Hexuronate transporter n=1 Tax=Sporomusa termitida TaxID=2377 RepID=A0A517DXC2_9FIRM|nr:MFS transporter [Sporomusa termitida]QDR81997.1 Hexuronate transporter [Sporomusa termitida]